MAGELGPQDEVCEANHYWIYLHETDELVRQLGIQPPRSLLAGDEATETQTQTKTEPDLDRTDPDLLRKNNNGNGHGEEGATTVMVRGGASTAATPPLSQAPQADEIPLSAPPLPMAAATVTPATAEAPEAPLAPIPAPPSPAPTQTGPSVLYRPMVLGDIQQRPSAWRAVLLVLLALAAAAIVLVIGLLRR